MRNLLNVPAAAELLGADPLYVRALVARRAIPFVKLTPGRNGPIRFRPDDLEAWLADRTVAAQD